MGAVTTMSSMAKAYVGSSLTERAAASLSAFLQVVAENARGGENTSAYERE